MAHRILIGRRWKPSIKAVKPAEFVGLRAKRAKAVDWVAAVAVANRDPAKQHLIGRKIQQVPHDLVHTYPSHLRTAVQPIAARQKRQRVDIAPEVCPLAGAEPTINRDEETHWSVEKLVIALDLFIPSNPIL